MPTTTNDRRNSSDKWANLSDKFGPLIGGKDLLQALGFRSQQSLRQAVLRGTVPVKVFGLEGRRGKFALTADIECWLASISNQKKGGQSPE